MSDDELIAGFRNSKELEILAILYGRYMELVYAVCWRYLKDAEASKDAVMDIYEALSEKLTRHDVKNFRSWLHSVARNHCLMKIRSASKTRMIDFNEEFVQFSDNGHQEEVQEKEEQLIILEDCIKRLPAEQKQVIDLFYIEQQCYHAIVIATGFEWNKVRSLVQNGRRNLKLCMEKRMSSTSERTGTNE